MFERKFEGSARPLIAYSYPRARCVAYHMTRLARVIIFSAFFSKISCIKQFKHFNGAIPADHT